MHIPKTTRLRFPVAAVLALVVFCLSLPGATQTAALQRSTKLPPLPADIENQIRLVADIRLNHTRSETRRIFMEYLSRGYSINGQIASRALSDAVARANDLFTYNWGYSHEGRSFYYNALRDAIEQQEQMQAHSMVDLFDNLFGTTDGGGGNE